MPRSTVARRALFLLAWIALLWAMVAYFSGGVGWRLGPLRLSSRQPLRPFLIGLAAAAVYLWRYTREERSDDAQWLAPWFSRMGRVALPLAVILGLAVGLYFGSFAAAGSDSYGYVSQAHLWLTGSLRVEQPFVQQFSWPNRDWVFTPLGYKPLSSDGVIVPTYPPGLPMLMAAFLAVFGENGPFLVVPAMGAATLWLTVLLGKQTTGSTVVGLLAAFMLLCAPAFLGHEIVPMSDVPVAAGWTLTCLLALRQLPLGAGLAAAVSLMIRPNLVALTLMPVVAWQGRREPLPRYAMGLLPGVAFIAVFNALLYGGPLVSGYGPFVESYALSGGPANLRNYLTWIVQTETPFILLALVPLFVKGALVDDREDVSARNGLIALFLLTLVSYLFYHVFNHWFYLRFLLPGYPALFVLTAAGVRWLALKLPAELRALATALACVWIMAFGLKLAKDTGIFNQARFERRHVLAGRAVAASTPPQAAVFAVQHSGSVRHYANRVTLRYDEVPSDRLDAVVKDLKTAGLRPYVVVDDWEEAEFRNRFGPHSSIGKLGWPPLARVQGSPEVRIYAID
jgi:hypothetical protein